MRSLNFVTFMAAMLCHETASSFSFGNMERKRSSTLRMASTTIEGDSRRDFFTKTGAAIGGLGFGVLAPPPALAVGGIDRVNNKLKSYGLPVLGKVPNGFSPLLEIYGQGKNRFPLLVQFCHPVTWVVTVPSNDVNGESGTVQAGEYAKGDTATLFVYTVDGHVDDIANQPKSFFENVLIKAISQKGANIYQNFKVTKIVPQEGTNYVTCDFRYELLTGAGFEVDRRGVASITSEGPAVEALWTASTRQRYKTTEDSLRDIAASFRVYADGINLSDELIKYDDDY